MKSNKTPIFPDDFPEEPAMNVVVYRNPGPDEDKILSHAQHVARTRSRCGAGIGLGYVTLFEPDFDLVWGGVSRGDVYQIMANSVLRLLGPKTEQFMGRVDDFIFGWDGGKDPEYGNVLLLTIIPRPHVLVVFN